MNRLAKTLLSRPEISALVMLLVVLVGFALYAPQFMSQANLRVILFALPELGILALGVGILMIAGEFDLSVGSVFALVPMLIVVLTGKLGLPPAVAIVVGLCAGLVVGYINGWITLTFNIPSFVTTLGMLFIARSTATVLSGGFPPPFPTTAPTWLFVADLGLFRASMLWFLLFIAVLAIVLHRTNLGNWIYATGGQRQAADDMGIDTRKVKLFCFMLCSFLAGFAGMITTFRLRSALPSLGEGLELQAIAAAVIGGTSLMGGIGSIAGFLIGTVLIRAIDNGLVMARIDANWFRMAIGTLTILAVILNISLRARARKMKG
ncbi:MAG TPA: ABC transporter permease [Geminicoccus sp.]|jgi:simple sugar transport system permease protein|uniref:ABC transporter permease n=1 Tax=Geminicoccus sp. TaxID=2024832 RepID=UPI002E2EB3CA|nr:ABC transporter permease [Geminicoccus sp.]HEX2525966.1 ABC transporter permease [Geminicoccus sp.]